MSFKSLVFALAIAASATLGGCGDSSKTIDGAPGDFTLEAADLAGGQFSTSQILSISSIMRFRTDSISS